MLAAQKTSFQFLGTRSGLRDEILLPSLTKRVQRIAVTTPVWVLALRSLAADPLPWLIALRTLASESGPLPPAPTTHTGVMLAHAASPVALFALGAMLARGQMASSVSSGAGSGVLDVVTFMILLRALLVC